MLKHLAFLLLLVLVACSPDDGAPPPPIAREDLVEIIAESLILEPAGRELPNVEQDSVYQMHYGRMLQRRGYTLDDFTASMQALQRNPKELEAVYEEVLEQIQIIESEVGN